MKVMQKTRKEMIKAWKDTSMCGEGKVDVVCWTQAIL